MFVRNGIHHRMANPMRPAAVLPITGAMIRTADDKRIFPQGFPAVKQTAKLRIHITQGRPMALQTVPAIGNSAFQIKIIRIMNGVHIQIEENRPAALDMNQFFQQEIHLVFGAVLYPAGKRGIPVAFLDRKSVV